MRRRALLITVLLLPLAGADAWPWGYEFHKAVNAGAVELLDEPLRSFYRAHLGEIVSRSTDPDKWTEAKSYPGYTHYIDLDELDNAPFTGIPKTWQAAVEKYGEGKLRKAGTLPWEIERRKADLTRAFREGRTGDAVQQSAWIAHFLTDATMPLHTTADYHGRKAGNLFFEGLEGDVRSRRSVHMRLEWGLIEKFPEHYLGLRGDAGNVRRIDDVLREVWTTVHDSYDLLAPVLAGDRQATALDPTCGQGYYDAFDGSMRALVSQRMRRAQELVASVWLTAWEDAGKPDLPPGGGPPGIVEYEDTPFLPPWAKVVLPGGIGLLLVLGWLVLRAPSNRARR